MTTGPHRELAERLEVTLEATATDLATVFGRDRGRPPQFRSHGRQFVEAAILFGCARRALQSPAPAVRRALSAIAGLLDDGVRHPANRAMLRRLPRLASGPMGIVHAVLTEAGVPDEAFHHEMRAALRSPHSRIGERLPFRELEGAWVRWKVLPEAPEPTSCLPASALIAGQPHPLYVTSDDLDAITHGLWFLTDFGQFPPVGVDAAAMARSLDQITAWQGNLGAAGRVAELLAARAVLGQPSSAHSRAATTLVAQHWAGLVPALKATPPARIHDATIHGLFSALGLSAGPVPASSLEDAESFGFDGALIRSVRRGDRAGALPFVASAEANPHLARRSLALDEVRAFLEHGLPPEEEQPSVEQSEQSRDTVPVELVRAAVRDVYDRAASTYGRHAAQAFSRIGELLVQRAGVARGMQVLDVGTGRGAALWPALRSVGPEGHVTGIDLSEQMVRHLAADIARGGHANATAQLMDAEALAFDDESFDAVLCAQALPFVPDPGRALAEMFRVLRPGGVVAVANKAAFDRRWSWDSRLLAAYPHSRVQLVTSPLATSPELNAGLSAAGFVDYDATVEELELVFDSLEDYWGYVWSTGLRASLDRLTPAELSEYRRNCEARLRRMEAEGGIRQRYQVLLAQARRPSTVLTRARF